MEFAVLKLNKMNNIKKLRYDVKTKKHKDIQRGKENQKKNKSLRFIWKDTCRFTVTVRLILGNRVISIVL